MRSGLKRSITGIQPSGTVHIGNYLGMIKPALALQQEFQCVYFIADLHALTTNSDARLLKSWTADLVATWVALGLDTESQILYRQSDVPLVAEFAWYLSCATGLGLLEKAHAYKDALAKGREISHGVFAYPVLMAADILLYDADVVPVGKDQVQHVEMARDMAGSFNARYNSPAIKLPEVRVKEDVMVIPGTDGRKMSKSYGNTIPLFAPEKELKKIVMGIVTDSTPLEQPKSLKGTLIGDYFPLFASTERVADLEHRLNQGGLGWGHAKQELFEVMNTALASGRKQYEEIRSDERLLNEILKKGAEKAFNLAKPVLNRVREVVGFDRSNLSLDW